MKKFGFDDTLLSFAVCAVLAILGCVGIVAWHDAKTDVAAAVTALASSSVSPTGTSR
jgi:hypothetical protein